MCVIAYNVVSATEQLLWVLAAFNIYFGREIKRHDVFLSFLVSGKVKNGTDWADWESFALDPLLREWILQHHLL